MENQRVRLTRDHRALSFGIGFVVLALAVVIILHFELRQYIDLYLNELYARKSKVPAVGDFGSAGEYFNLVIGVPLALFGVLIAVAVSIILAQFTLTKDDIAIFTFVESVMRPVSERIKGLVASFTQLVGIGGKCGELVEKVDHAVSESDDHTLNVDFVDCLSVDQQNEFLSDMRTYLDSMTAAIGEWAQQYEQLLGTMYGTLFAHERIRIALDAKPCGTVNTYLRMTLPTPLLSQVGFIQAQEEKSTLKARRHKTRRTKRGPRDPDEYSNDVRRILSYLNTNDRNTKEALQLFCLAAYLLPDKSTSLELVGLAIRLSIILFEKPRRLFHRGTIHGYMINIGAAQLLTLYQYIPDRSAIETALNRIFEHRSKAAERFLRRAAPTPRDFTSFEMDDSICSLFDHPERMIVVLVETGNGAITGETYDRCRHGEIPATGYKPYHADE